MSWIRGHNGRARVDHSAVKARLDRGRAIVILVTLVLLVAPILEIFSAPGNGPSDIVLHTLVQILIAGVLVYLLWTRVPFFRWIVAVALLGTGAHTVVDYLLASQGSGSIADVVHGMLRVVSSATLGLSASVKTYLAHREVGL